MIGVLVLSLTLTNGDISGVVRDPSGAVVPGASVIARGAGGEQRALTGTDGRFTVGTTETGDVVLVVRADGFAEKQQPAPVGARDVEVVLAPASLLENVTVTASRTEQRLGDVPESVSVLGSKEIRESPAVVADDVLRQVPTFSLFRRTSSLSSHPTSQGVSLRGIGPSGVSRTLVLIDNVPFNDPFGGWVYWTRVPLDSVDRVEIVDGSSSSLYGNYAMGGVINIVSSRPVRRTFEFKPQYGNRNSPKADFFASDVWGKLGVAVEGSTFDTDGFPIVAASERGPIDRNATVNFHNVNGKIDYAPSSRVTAFFRGGYFHEKRDNAKVSTFDGTPEGNDTTWKSASGGIRVLLPDESDLQARVFTDFETFHSNFLAVPNPTTRATGRMTLNQTVPTNGVGGMAQWSRAFGTRNFVSAGTDLRWVDGESREDGLDAQTGLTVTLKRASGGTQTSTGAFVQDLFTPIDKLTLTGSIRLDHWRNYNAHNLESSFPSGVPTANNKPQLAERGDTVASPRLAALYHVTRRLNVWGAMSSGFRAPTLNELYRQFRVGAILTLANENLGPERLVGGEGGLNLALTRNLTVRTTVFDNRVRNPVSNVTIANNTQQRQNLGRTEIWGMQADAEYRISEAFRVAGAYVYDQATVKEFAANPALANNCPGRPGESCLLPQVPAHRGSMHVSYSNVKYATVALGVQLLGRQFDDDQNLRAVPPAALNNAGYDANTGPGLPGYAVVDVTASRTIVRNFEVFFGVQNLFDKEYFVGTLPTTIGSPRLVNGGARVRFAGR